jgi:NADH dehydrogenase FAD-containing subunit
MTPLLFEVFSGSLDLRSCSSPIRALLHTTCFVEANVVGIDLERRVVRLASAGERGELAYDQLVLAGDLVRALDGQPPEPFVYSTMGMMGSLGHSQAIGQLLKVRVHGFPAWLLRRTY